MAREPAKRRSGSVFDFLYVDRKRIELFTSQFSDFGNLTSLVRSQTVSDATKLSGGIPEIVEGGKERSQQTGVERHYNTQWTETLNFLDEIQARRMLTRGIATAGMGDLFLVSGSLNLLNMRAFERTWEAVSELPERRGNRHERRAGTALRTTREGSGSSGMKILASLAQPIFMLLQTEAVRLWSTLDPDCVTGGSTDLHLKHGVKVAGDWHLLGILDCLPGAADVSAEEIGQLCGSKDNPFGSSIVDVLRELRLVMGRPSDCYGVTPLIIMRELARSA